MPGPPKSKRPNDFPWCLQLALVKFDEDQCGRLIWLSKKEIFVNLFDVYEYSKPPSVNILKHEQYGSIHAFNRTIMKLKFVHDGLVKIGASPFNRTMVELKYIRKPHNLVGGKLNSLTLKSSLPLSAS